MISNNNYNSYSTSLYLNIKTLNDKVKNLNKSKDVLINMINSFNIKVNLDKLIASNSYYQSTITKIVASLSKDSSNIFNTLRAYKYTIKDINSINTSIDNLKIKDISQDCYNEIVNTFHDETVKHLLKGGIFEIPKLSSTLCIVRYKPKRYKARVDYNESFKQLLELSKEYDIYNYERYINKEINRFELISLVKPKLYSNFNTKAPKWLVYHDNDVDYLYKLTPSSNMRRLYMFKFRPTDSNNIKGRNQNDFANTHTEEEIINCRQLGSKQKLNCLKHIKSNYISKYIDNELYIR